MSHVDLVRLDGDLPAESAIPRSSSPVQARQVMSPLSSPCEGSGVPDAPSWQGFLDPSTAHHTKCLDVPKAGVSNPPFGKYTEICHQISWLDAQERYPGG